MAEDSANNQTIEEESGLSPNWHPVDAAAIVPGRQNQPGTPPASSGPGSYYRGAIAPSMQHDATLVRTGDYPRIATNPLVPFSPAANAQANAAIKSIVEKSITPVPAAITGMVFKGVYAPTGLYTVQNVVVFNLSAYVALNTSSGMQPDLSPLNWELLSENFVFNPAVTTTGNPGFGTFDGSAQDAGSVSNILVGPVTPSAAGDLALLVLSGNSGALSSGWVDEKVGGNSGLFFIKSLPTAAIVSENLGLYTVGQWSTNILLFQSNGQSIIANVGTIAINGSNTLTCTCANTFLPGTNVVFSGLTTATFLNGQIVKVLSSNGSSFTATFSHSSYGPAADTGVANNLMYLQLESVLNGAHSGATTYTPAFANNVTKGSLIVIPFVTSDNNATNTFTTVNDSQGNTYTIKNNSAGGGCSFAWTFASASGPLTATIITAGNSSFSAMVMYEMLGGGSSFLYHFLPYDVQQFRGSTYVCLTETTGDAFAAPTHWAQLAQGTGSIQIETASYLSTTADSGRLISFNSASSLTLTLPATPPQLTAPQSSGWWIAVQNIGAGTLTISPNGLNIDGSASSLTLGQNQGTLIFTDGINYYTSHAVTSVTVPSILTVSGPNASGVVAIGLATEAANTGLRGPTTGSAAVPTFRALVNADLPTSAVTAGSYTNTNLTVNAQGIITAAANGSSSAGGGVNAQTSSYLALSTDNEKLISMNGSSLTLTLPAAPPSSTWWIAVENVNSTTLTVARNGLNIDGAASNLSLLQNQGVLIYTDGTNYFTERGMASGGGGGAPTTDTYLLGTQDFSNLPNSAANPTAFYGIDAQPASAGTLDDEFNGSTLNLSRWTKVNFTGGAAANISNSLLSFVGDAATGNQAAIVQTSPSTPWTVVTKITSASLLSASGYRLAGIAVFATGTITSAKCIYFTFDWGNSGATIGFGQTNFNSIAGSFSSAPFTLNPTLGSVPPTVWLSLNNNGTTLTFTYSTDGVNFIPLTTYAVATFTGTIGYVGLVVGGTSTAPTAYSFDYFRRTL